jgi:hypothetical protein
MPITAAAAAAAAAAATAAAHVCCTTTAAAAFLIRPLNQRNRIHVIAVRLAGWVHNPILMTMDQFSQRCHELVSFCCIAQCHRRGRPTTLDHVGKAEPRGDSEHDEDVFDEGKPSGATATVTNLPDQQNGHHRSSFTCLAACFFGDVNSTSTWSGFKMVVLRFCTSAEQTYTHSNQPTAGWQMGGDEGDLRLLS